MKKLFVAVSVVLCMFILMGCNVFDLFSEFSNNAYTQNTQDTQNVQSTQTDNAEFLEMIDPYGIILEESIPLSELPPEFISDEIAESDIYYYQGINVHYMTSAFRSEIIGVTNAYLDLVYTNKFSESNYNIGEYWYMYESNGQSEDLYNQINSFFMSILSNETRDKQAVYNNLSEALPNWYFSEMSKAYYLSDNKYCVVDVIENTVYLSIVNTHGI